MHVRALALALPLVLGVACKTSSTQSSGSSGKTAAPEGSAAQPQTATSSPNDPASGRRAEEGTGTDAGNTSAAQSSATSAAEIDKDRSATSGSPSGSMGTARDPLMVEDHQPIKAHASDKVVSGTISKAEGRSVSIMGSDGATKTLVIAPETAIIDEDGADVQRSMLHEGDRINASYNRVQGDDIAVVIEVVPLPDTGSSDSPSTGTDTGAARPGTTGQ